MYIRMLGGLGGRGSGGDDGCCCREKTITVRCDDKFAISGEWKALKSALDPHWVPPEVGGR